MNTNEKIRTFLVQELRCSVPIDELTDDYALIENQVVDSMGIYEVVTFVEAEYGIEVSDDDLVPENFDSIASIARLVEEKRKSESSR